MKLSLNNRKKSRFSSNDRERNFKRYSKKRFFEILFKARRKKKREFRQMIVRKTAKEWPLRRRKLVAKSKNSRHGTTGDRKSAHKLETRKNYFFFFLQINL